MFTTASWRSSSVFSKRSNACPSLVSSTANMVMARLFLLPGAQKGAWSNCYIQVSLKQPEQAGTHLQLEELGKASDTVLMVQCLLPEAQHGATAVLWLHRALMESAARWNFSAAFAQEKDCGKKYLYLLEMSIVATFLPWRNYLQTYRKDTFFQENVEDLDTKIEACHLSPGTELQQTHWWGQKALFPLWLCSDFNTWLQQLLSLP